jgi:hypothetical protein
MTRTLGADHERLELTARIISRVTVWPGTCLDKARSTILTGPIAHASHKTRSAWQTSSANHRLFSQPQAGSLLGNKATTCQCLAKKPPQCRRKYIPRLWLATSAGRSLLYKRRGRLVSLPKRPHCQAISSPRSACKRSRSAKLNLRSTLRPFVAYRIFFLPVL